jgi:molybdopterin/thiamine biosynthesis adenylyltransferase
MESSSAIQSERYARHLTLPEIGPAGQERLRLSKVLVVGVGGLGSPAAFYLVAAGIGTVGLVDSDVVDLSNLQRQILHAEEDIGHRKVESAARKLRALNPEVEVRCHPVRLGPDDAAGLFSGYDMVLDATDNFPAKFLIADVCHAVSKPYVHAGILRFGGQVMTVIPGQTACYRCVFSSAPPAVAGVPAGPVGAVPGVVGAIEAMEAIKVLLGIGVPLTNRLLTWDALNMSFREIQLSRNPDCPLCGNSGERIPETQSGGLQSA